MRQEYDERLRSHRFRRLIEALTIRDDDGNLLNIRFMESQEIIWSTIAPLLDINAAIRVIILKARQIGASTLTEALLFCRTIERPGTQSLVLAQDYDSSNYIFDMAKRFYEHLDVPKFAPPKAKEIQFPFPDGKSFFRVVSAGVPAKYRGGNFTCIHGSETAFWPHPELWTGLSQTLPQRPGTICVLESTAQGKVGEGELFYNEWQRAIAGESGFIPIFVEWYRLKKYRGSAIGIDPRSPDVWDEEEKVLHETFGIDADQLAWRHWAINNKCQGSIEQFHQEYPTTPEEAFISSGLPAFNELALIKQRPNIRPASYRGYMNATTGKFVEQKGGEIRIWELPVPGHQYVIGADTAEGIDNPSNPEQGDYSCAEIIDMATLEQVGCIHGKLPPWEFSLALANMGKWYNLAIINIEVNNTGHAVQDHMIRTHQYANLHQWKGKPDQIRLHRARLYGWDTNVYSRPLLIEAGRRAVNKVLCTIHEDKLIDELRSFSRNDQGKYEAEAGKDDRVMAFLLALRSREENYFPARKMIEISDREIALPAGVRVSENLPTKADERRNISKLLISKAKQGVKNWMQY